MPKLGLTKGGLGTFAETNHEPGKEILTDSIIISALFDEYLEKNCSYCFKLSSFRCAVCKEIKYCSSKCQKIDWRLHRAECNSFIKTKSKSQNRAIRFFARVLYWIKRHPSIKLPDSKNSDADRIANKEDFSRLSSIDLTKDQDSILFASGMTFVVPDAKYLRTLDEMLNLLGVLKNNGIGISNEEGVIIGVALLSRISFVNHSCLPNCVVSFQEAGSASLRAIRSIEMGQELTISYCDPLNERLQRRESLLVYNFTCSCELCNSEVLESMIRKAIVVKGEMDDALRVEDWKKCGFAALSLQSIYAEIFGLWPKIGVLFYTAYKCFSLINLMDLACQSGVNAVKVMQIFCRKESPLLKQLIYEIKTIAL